jgi:hypothetical protein
MTAATTTDRTQAESRVRAAAAHAYDAECALHAARRADADAWISAAAVKLHDAIVEHLSALDSADVTSRDR